MKTVFSAILITTLLLLGLAAVAPLYATGQGPPDIQKKVFVHFERSKSSPLDGGSGEKGFYKLIKGGVKWPSDKLPVPLEVNPDNPSGLSESDVLWAIAIAAEEWDDGAYSGWGGVTPNLYKAINPETGEILISVTTKGYDDLAWTSDKLDGANTIVWGDYPTDGVVAVTILWYNVKTKEIIEFDMVLDTDYEWSLTGEPGKMDLQNIVTHELGHGAGLDDLIQAKASEETMYAYADLGEIKKRDLYIGDQKGITKLYG